MEIAERFGLCSEAYKNIRPSYPDDLILYLKRTFSDACTVLDCGTGNGQVAIKLAEHFSNIIAIDYQENQIKNAIKKNNIQYLVMQSEDLKIENNSVDMITCASSLHWFNLDKFYSECNRVMKPKSGIAAWSYTWPKTKNDILAQKLSRLLEKVYQYLPSETLLHINMYRTIDFPFNKIHAPSFTIHKLWTCNDICKFFMTWASILEYIESIDNNLIIDFKKSILDVFPDNVVFEIELPIAMLCGTT